jgi:Putative auto-transporter adhesin, head GIN domain
MNKTHISLIAALTVFLAGCGLRGIPGNGHIKTEQRTIGAFAQIQADGAFDIEWHSGAPALSIATDGNLLQYIDNEITGDRLRIHSTKRLAPSHSIKVVISSAVLNGAHLTGATRLKANQISGDKFYLKATGASEITINGSINELLASMTGASELNAKSLQTKIVEISTTGAADAEVTVTETLKVAITGAGSVNYFGNPPNVEKHVTGAGTIKHRE